MRGSLVVCLAAAIARADAPPDSVELHDGTFLQGRLTEWKPSVRAVIVLLNGESRIVRWDEIAHTSGPSFEQIRDAEPPRLDPPPSLVIPPQSLRAPPKPSYALMDARQRRGMQVLIASVGPSIFGIAFGAVGLMLTAPDMTDVRNSFLGIGSAFLVAATATFVGGMVLFTHKRDKLASLTLTPAGLSGSF
jgi:hypothetical protein